MKKSGKAYKNLKPAKRVPKQKMSYMKKTTSKMRTRLKNNPYSKK